VGNDFFVVPAIWVASRNGNRRYCGADDGYPFGSSASNLDHAQNTLICGNHFLAIEGSEILKINDGPTRVEGNRVLDPNFAAAPVPFAGFVTVGTTRAPAYAGNDVGSVKRSDAAASCLNAKLPDGQPVRMPQ
jgi:hypothetical protein